MCWLSISWLLLQPGRTDLALWRSWLEWNIMDAKRRWYLLHSSLANINDDSPLPSLQARQRFWQRSCKVRVELVEMTAGEDFLIKLLQRLQLWKLCNTAETGVLWRAEQWLERLCSSRCRHGKDSMVTSPYLQFQRSRYRTGLMWCPTCRRKLGGVQEWQKYRRLKQMIHLGTADLRLLAGYARCGATVCDLESSSRQPYSHYFTVFTEPCIVPLISHAFLRW